jgi:mono/diheme cytochrome c family protein
MIGWPDFSNQDVDNIIYYLKTFSDDFEKPDYYDLPIAIPDPPSFSRESAEQGREIFLRMECHTCHGDQGRGDGASAPALTNDAGQTILPADLTKRWTFRGGPTRQDIYRTFSTGLNGTPMPSYADSLTVEERWRLVDYVYSLGAADEPNYSEQLIAKSTEDDLDLARGEALFEGAESAFFPLIGQIVEPGRAFHPAANRIEAKAVHNREHIAFLVRWHDMRADVAGENSPALEAPEMTGTIPEEEPRAEDDVFDPFGDAVEPEVEEDTGDDFWGDVTDEEDATDDFFSMEDERGDSPPADAGFSDAVALQLPSALPEGIRLPYFIFGDSKNPVDIWFADLAQEQPQRFVGRGSRSLTPGDPDGLEMMASYDAGVWTVIFKRKRRVDDTIAIDEDQWYPIAFSVWDGWSADRGNKRALTRWYYVYVEPAETIGPMVPMARAALATLGIEILLVALIRRRYKNLTIPRTDA